VSASSVIIMLSRFLNENYKKASVNEPASASKPRLSSRIAVVAGSLDIVGGQEVQARILCEELRGQGYTVSFIPINPAFPRGLKWLKQLPYLRTVINELIYIPTLYGFRDADVVHIFSASYWSFLLAPLPALLAAKALGKRTILNYHSGEASDHLARWGALVHPWLKLADEIVVPSGYLARVFARYGYHARVIPNVVHLSHFHFRERRPLHPRLVSTRNLEPIYRVDNTIRAFTLLKSRYPDLTLTIAGSGSEAERLRRLAAPFTDESIRFLGRVEPSRISAVYDNADIFVNSSIVDNQPLSVLEAFASGLPVVSTPTGGIADMVRDGETGCIVAPDDPRTMADAVAILLEQPERAAIMARQAYKEVEKHTWRNVRLQWLEIYGCGLAADEVDADDKRIEIDKQPHGYRRRPEAYHR
jgi:L-malate glycosyltransferase